MRISDVLEHKGSSVATIAPEAPIIDLVRELGEHSIGALVVSDGDGSIAGMASERDVVRAVGRFGPSILEEPVQMIMSRKVRTCTSEDTVDALMAVMTEFRVRHVPVVDDSGALAGIVSIGDLVKARIDELESDRDALEHYITAR